MEKPSPALIPKAAQEILQGCELGKSQQDATAASLQTPLLSWKASVHPRGQAGVQNGCIPGGQKFFLYAWGSTLGSFSAKL